MGDLNKGETFAAGETVSAARLHSLVEDATIKNGVVTTAKLADGSVTTAKLASSVALTATQVTLPENKVLVGNASNVGAAVAIDTATMDPAGFGVKDLGISAAKLAANAVTTAKILDANVTLAKIVNVTAARLLGNAGGSAAAPAEIALSTGLEFSGGALRVTTAISGGLATKYSGTASIPSAGAIATVSHGLGATPSLVLVYLECLVNSLGYRADTGSGNPDLVPTDSVFSSSFVPAFTLNVNDTSIEVIRYAATSTVYVFKRTSGGVGIGQYDEITTNLATNWRLRIIAWV